MKARIVLACIAICAVSWSTNAAAEQRQKLSCNRGGHPGRYGGTDWLIFGCSDERSLIFVSAPGSPAVPFIFVLTPKDGAYQLDGEGTGEKALTDAAYAEIHALTPAQISALLDAAATDRP